MVIAVSCDPIWRKICEWTRMSDKTGADIMQDARLVEKNGGVSEPEFRLPSTMMYDHIEHG